MKSQNTENTKEYWKSLDEYAQSPQGQQALEQEFMSSPLASEDGKDGVARREFLKLMGASLALTSVSCVRRPVQKIVPYAQAPKDVIPGVSNFYSSSLVEGGEGFGIIVKTREGKPVKIEGNPDHPSNRGGLSARAQAHILSLYDPDRIKTPLKVGRKGESQKITWETLDKSVSESIKNGQTVLLTSSLASPSTKQLIKDFFQGASGKVVTWDPLGAGDLADGQDASYGSRVTPRYRIEQAQVIVSIDCDFLGTYLAPTEHAKGFSAARKPRKEMTKLVSFESMVSLTGANADARIRIKPSQQVAVVMGLLNQIIVKQGASRYAGDASVKAILSRYDKVAEQIGMDSALFAEIAKDLWAHRGQGLVLAGGLTTRTQDSDSLHVAVNFLNSILENDGKTIDTTQSPHTSYEGSTKELLALIEDMKAGKVGTLIVHRLNPAYSLPASAGFNEALAKVRTVITTADRLDETTVLADFVAPDHHDMENWGDSEVHRGVYAIQQPTIRPLYETRALQSSLMTWAGLLKKGPARITQNANWYDYLRDRWKDVQRQANAGGSFEDFWTNTLKNGVVDTAKGRRDSSSGARGLKSSLSSVKTAATSTGLELVLYPTIGMGDGTHANIPWLLEFPDPITKNVWDSYICVSPNRAKTMNLEVGHVVNIKTSTGKLEGVPVYIQPGVHDDVVAVAVGFGRTHAGRIGNIGVNAFQLAQVQKGQIVTAGFPCEIETTGKTMDLANTQGHNSMEGRQIVVEANLESYLKNPESNIHRHKTFSIWSTHEYKGHKWGMSIDLNSCTGCSACVVACQSENNIPVVGKKYVLNGREMHWIRIDRYYSGDPTNPEVVFQPLTCQHCDNAPCETVCPVAATVHSNEGLNEMVYNRCVGTRYCSNNCPYKVRRFNWFNYQGDRNPYRLSTAPLNQALNPEVTVRSRGVMEKCTFCVQRIHQAKNDAKDAGTTVVKDGAIVTACEQSCPSNAIVFGDLNDPESRVAKMFKEKRAYALLEEVNTQPAIRYMSKIRNVSSKGSEKQHDEGGHV